MKKTLLLLGAAFAATTAIAAEPVVYQGAAIMQLSPNGRYGMSAYGDGNIEIFDFEKNERVTFTCSEDGGNPYYGSGLGNGISNDGIAVGSTTMQGNAAYYYNGEWKTLTTPANENLINSPNGITPDGSRICGNIGNAAFGLESSLMCIPAVWNRNADGTYGDYVLLPYPDKDMFGEAPQYVTAISISEDGKTIAGQLVDNRGFYTEPVIYTEGADGKWSYTMPIHDLYNPDHLELLPNPGEAPAAPDLESYMTADEIEAYNAALKAWQDEGTWDYSKYPNKEDYLSEEGKTRYKAAMEEYNVAYQAWMEKYEEYDNRVREILAASPNFVFNNVLLSADGKTLGGTQEAEDPDAIGGWGPTPSIYTPTLINLETKELTKISSLGSLQATCLVDGGILATTGLMSEAVVAYVLKADGTGQPLYDYLCAKSPELASWCKKNLVHNVEVYDAELDDYVVKEMTLTGLPFATADMGIITTCTQAVWEDWDFYTYYFNMAQLSGVDNIRASHPAVVKAVGGIIYVEGDVESLEVYDLAGKLVRTVADPAQAVDPQLGHGTYIVKATCSDGATQSIKLAL